MTDLIAAADLALAARWAGDVHDGVVAAIDRARLVCYDTRWQARSAQAFHDAVATWTVDLQTLRRIVSELAAEAADAAERLSRIDAETLRSGASVR